MSKCVVRQNAAADDVASVVLPRRQFAAAVSLGIAIVVATAAQQQHKLNTPEGLFDIHPLSHFRDALSARQQICGVKSVRLADGGPTLVMTMAVQLFFTSQA